MTQYMLGQEAAARVSLERALQTKADFPEIEKGRARLAVLGVNVDAAGASEQKFLEEHALRYPDDPIALARLAAIYERTGAVGKAIDGYEAALKINSQDPTVLLRLARLRAAKGENAAAFELAKTAHNLAPNDSDTSHFLGQLAYRMGDYAWSASLLGEMAAKEPNNAEVLFDLAEANYSLGHEDAAAEEIQRALDANGSFSLAERARRFLELIRADEDSSLLAASVADAEATLRSEPNDVPALMIRGANLEKSGDFAGAIRVFEGVLTVIPNFSLADKRLVLLYAEHAGNDQRESEVAAKASEAFPGVPEVAKACGIIAYRHGEYRRAENFLQICVDAKAGDAEGLFYLGMAQHHLNVKSSSANLQRSLDLNLRSDLAAEARQILAEGGK
jgi:tetratricopeptide (TPR) repeat protein